MVERIDAHHHFWRYSEAEYGWIGQDMEQLRRDFLATDLEPEIAAADVQGVLTVQARQTIEETNWLLSLAEQSSFVRGVIGWAPIASPEFPSLLGSLVENRKLKGLRHVLQDEPDETYMLQPCFQRGISALKGTGLVYDILIYERQLPTALLLVDSHPEQIFVLDHLGKPKIRYREFSPWRDGLQELGARPNVYCKLSGMATEADWTSWTTDDLRPYFDVALECFGADRLLAGSDWPVCTVATSYQRWWRTVRELVSALSPDEQNGILGRNAKSVYKLEGEMK